MRRLLRYTGYMLLGYLLMAGSAYGEYLGSDPFENIGPTDKVGGLASKYPLDRYGLDYHVNFGPTNPGGIVQVIQHAFAQQLWDLVANVLKLSIDVFAWAFNVDLLNGPNGALPAVSAGVHNLNTQVISDGWLYFAVTVLGGWGMWKALGQRQLGAAVSGFLVSLLCAGLAMTIIASPEKTIGNASEFANGISTSFISGFGAFGDGTETRTDITDHLFDTMIYKPWVVLEFGGLAHCVDTDDKNEDGYPAPVRPDDPKRDVCRDHITQNSAGYGGYAERFLKLRLGTDARDYEYEALKKGETPEAETNISDCPRGTCSDQQREARQGLEDQFKDYKVDKNDSPAVDIQQAGGARSRVRAVTLIAIGALGVFLLFGRLSITVLIAQIIALALLGLAPIALIVGMFPAGHKFFKWWITRLFVAIFIKVIYAIVIAVMIAVSAALLYATSTAGFLVSFGLQAVYFWTIYLKRKMIVAELSEALGSGGMSGRSAALTAAGVYAATRPMRSMSKGVKRSMRGSAAGAAAGAAAGTRGGKDKDATEDDTSLEPGGSDHDRDNFDDRVRMDPSSEEAVSRWMAEEDGHTGNGNGNGSAPRGRRGKRKYRVLSKDELADMGGDSNGRKVTFGLVGTERESDEESNTSSGEPDSAEQETNEQETVREPRREEDPSPRELAAETSSRVRKRRKRRLKSVGDGDTATETEGSDKWAGDGDQVQLFDNEA